MLKFISSALAKLNPTLSRPFRILDKCRRRWIITPGGSSWSAIGNWNGKQEGGLLHFSANSFDELQIKINESC